MIADALAAFEQLFTRASRAALWRSLLATLALLGAAWAGLDWLIAREIAVATNSVETSWVATTLRVLAGLGLFVAGAFLVAPVSTLVASFFVDDVAEASERAMGRPPGRPAPLGATVRLGLNFALVSLVVNLGALALLLAPGINLVAFFGANAYLSGRAYFELAALRYRTIEDVRALRRTHALYLFACGALIAGFIAVPGLNLLTPLFASAFMARVHARLAPR